MSNPQQQPKKPDPPPAADPLPKVKVRWARGGELTDGRYDADRGVIHTTRAKRPVTVSVHSGVVEWWAPA
ncbi:MAG TPA: hypothetical protein VJ140_04130 [Actinomycetota bacterium]|nr:hypothetical protein [Actinomycetota bacterium]